MQTGRIGSSSAKAVIPNAGRNETFGRGSLYCESLIRGREQYKPLGRAHWRKSKRLGNSLACEFLVVADDFTTSAGTQRAPDRQADVLGKKPDAAVCHGALHSARVIAACRRIGRCGTRA
jgi:hypothetical protein